MSLWRFARFSIASLFAANEADGRDAGLRALAAELSIALAPVAPRAPFRLELGRELAAVARQRQSPRIVLQRPPSYRRGILIGAAAVSSAVSVAGLVALIWRRRIHQVSALQG